MLRVLFEQEITIRMHDIDAAGVLFFAHQFRLVHDVYENFLTELGFSIAEQLKGDVILPIVHAEADYLAPLSLGDVLTVQLQLEKLGSRSFTLLADLVREARAVGRVRTVHVAVHRPSGQSCALPEELKVKLAHYVSK